MKKYVLDNDAEEQIINRMLKLSPASERSWGDMSVDEMLFPCRKVNNEILQSEQQNKTPAVGQKIMKIIGLYLMKEFPKGIKTGPKYLPELIDNIDFRKMQNELFDSIKEVSNYNNAIYGEYPFFGPLNTRAWRRFIWKHVDHHISNSMFEKTAAIGACCKAGWKFNEFKPWDKPCAIAIPA